MYLSSPASQQQYGVERTSSLNKNANNNTNSNMDAYSSTNHDRPTNTTVSAGNVPNRVILPHRPRRQRVGETTGAFVGEVGGVGAHAQTNAPASFFSLRGDVAQTDLTTIASNAQELAQSALNPQRPLVGSAPSSRPVANDLANPIEGQGLPTRQQQNHTSLSSPTASTVSGAAPRRANSSLSVDNTVPYASLNISSGRVPPTASAASPLNSPPANARISSSAAVFRSRVEEGARLGGGDLAPTSRLVSKSVVERFSSTTEWHNQQRYHPVNVMLSPLLQDKQLSELKEALFAPVKKKRGSSIAPSGGEGGGGGGSAFLTSTDLDGGPTSSSFARGSLTGNPNDTATSATRSKKKGIPQSTTSYLNNNIGLRRIPNNDIALNEVFAAHSVSLKPPDAPLFGGALTTEGGKKKGAGSAVGGQRGSLANGGTDATSITPITTANLGSTIPSGGKKGKKGPVAPLISNISAIHRGLAPSVDLSTGLIPLFSIQRYVASLVPPEYEQSAVQEYIRPFLKQCYDEHVRLQMTSGGSAIAGSAGAEADDLLNQTSVSATTETQSNAGDIAVNDAASTVGVRSVRAASRAGTTIRAPSVVATDIGSRAASPSSHAFARHGSPSQASLGGGATSLSRTGIQINSLAAAAQHKVQRERQEEEFFATIRLPYTHVISFFEHLLKPNAAQPVSNMVADDVSGALLSARVCFMLCDPLHRGYITRESIKSMRSDQATNEDYNFNVVQGLTRAMQIIDKLEEERYAILSKKSRKGKAASKKPVPLPTVRQFHMSLDEFTHLMCTDAYLPLAFLPYIIKTFVSGRRAEVAQQRMQHYGRSQVAFQALQRANYREKKAAEANLNSPIQLDGMTAEQIKAVLEPRQYPPVVSALAGGGGDGGFSQNAARSSKGFGVGLSLSTDLQQRHEGDELGAEAGVEGGGIGVGV